jgi:hypothetical protein
MAFSFDAARTAAIDAMRKEGRHRDVISAFATLPQPGRIFADRTWRLTLPWLLTQLRDGEPGQAYEIIAGIGQRLGLETSPEAGNVLARIDAQRDDLVTALSAAALYVESHDIQALPDLEELGSVATWVAVLTEIGQAVERVLDDEHDESRGTAQRRSLALINRLVAMLAALPGDEIGMPCSLCESVDGCARCGGLRGLEDGSVAA